MWWRKRQEPAEGGEWTCEPCGFSCWLATADDLRANVAAHIQSPEHIERVKDEGL